MSTKPLVLLTGPTGFLGSHVLHALLAANYRVRGVVRSPAKSAFLAAKYPEATRTSDLAFVTVPDIQAAGALDAAASDAEYICHVASPYFVGTSDPVRDLIEPAVNGTRNVLGSALRAPKLRRLVIVSSFASVVDLSQNPRPGYVYTESDWNPLTLEEGAKNGVLGYHVSKTFAEKAAWELWGAARKEGTITWDLVTLCPPMIYGPVVQEVQTELSVDGLGTSMKRLVNALSGREDGAGGQVSVPGLPAWVDARDVARAHVQALALEKGVSERFLLCGGVDYFEDGLGGLRAKGEAGLGTEGRKVDKSQHFSLDTSKARTVLGMEFTPWQKTVEDSWESVKALGLL